MLRDVRAGPDGLEEPLAGDHLARPLRQRAEHLHDLRLELHDLALARDAVQAGLHEPLLPHAEVAGDTFFSHVSPSSSCQVFEVWVSGRGGLSVGPAGLKSTTGGPRRFPSKPCSGKTQE